MAWGLAAGPAEATIQDAQNAVVASLDDEADPFEDLCRRDQDGNLIVVESGNKVICQMIAPNQAFALTGCLDDGAACTGANGVEGQFQTLQILAATNVRTVEVGPAFLQNVPCFVADNNNCGAFVQEWLDGSEVKFSEVPEILALYDDPAACALNRQQVTDDIVDLYQAGGTPTFVTLRDTLNTPERRLAFVGDMNRIAAYGNATAQIDDLQGFVGAGGRFTVFDPDGLTDTQNMRLCFRNWTCAVAVAVAGGGQGFQPTCVNLQ